MAALLRQGARRIGGSVLQRTQAAVASPAVAEERGRLVPRCLYSTEEFMTLVNDLFPNNPEEQANEEITSKIQQKKEELYDVICKGEQSFWTSSFRNKRLLQHLAVQVNPRPEDYKWQLLRFSKRAINVVEIAGLAALTSLVVSAVLRFKQFLEDEKVVRAMMMDEVREAKEAQTRSGLIEN